MKLFNKFLEEIEKMPDKKKKYAVHIIKNISTLSQFDMFRNFDMEASEILTNIINYLSSSDEEIAEYIYIFYFQNLI